MAIRNMACQHQEFQSHLDDAEKPLLYAKSAASHSDFECFSGQGEIFSRALGEREAKVGATSIIQAENEKDKTKEESSVAQLVATVIGDAKPRVEADLTKALNSLAIEEEGERRSEAEVARLKAEFARVEGE